MKQISFKCTKDNVEFTLNSGLTKIQYLSYLDESQRLNQSKHIMDEQFTDFVNELKNHSQKCDGQIVVDLSSYRLVD